LHAIARTTVGNIAPSHAESVKQSRQIEPRQIQQVSAGTTGNIASTIARTTRCVARAAYSVAWTAIGEATAIQTEISERIQSTKRKSRCIATVDFSTRITIPHEITRIAERVASTITWTAQRRGGKQIPQTSAEAEPRSANFVARVARNLITGVAGDNWIARITVVGDDTNTADQPLETRKQIAASYSKSVARCPAGINTRTGICKTLDTQH
jgi:hypothetical protein